MILCANTGSLGSVAELYECLRHADFHKTAEDGMSNWGLAQYAAFSGAIVAHRLEPEDMARLWLEHKLWRECHRGEWEAASYRDQWRTVRDYLAIVHRYSCQVLGRYAPPASNPEIMRDLKKLDSATK